MSAQTHANMACERTKIVDANFFDLYKSEKVGNSVQHKENLGETL